MMKKYLFYAAFAAVATLLGSCSKEFVEPTPTTPDASAGKEVTATIKAEGVETRAGYDPAGDGELIFKWHADDAISVVVPGVAGNENRQFTTAEGGPRVQFSGTITSWDTPQTVYGVYPNTTTPTVTVDNTITASLSPVQTFKVGASRKNMLMVASTQASTQDDIKFSFKQGAATLRLAIANVPAGKTVQMVTVSSKDAEAIFATTADFDPATGTASNLRGKVSSITAAVANATAGAATTVDVGLLPDDLSGKTLTVKVRMASGEVYTLEKPGRVFARNIHVKLPVDCATITPAVSDKMQFTIDTSKGSATDKTFILPLSTSVASGEYTLTVDWGDGKTTPFAANAKPTLADLTHTYDNPGSYQITITSSQADASQAQIPSFNFKYNTTSNNKLKLISFDTPLLRINSTSFDSCLSGCKNLTSIPDGLFDNNPLATNFASCFNSCTALTSIPDGLFANNPWASNFWASFNSCTTLTSIPDGLFANNPAATDFSYCFGGCTTLTSIPDGLFANNPQATNFASCFSDCKTVTSIPTGLFDNNPAATNFSYCFSSCTNLTSIPDGLFDNNPAATNFASCFSSCRSLTSIPVGLFDNNLKATNFSNCFYGCSKLTSIPDGLFDNNPAATNFMSCFNSCEILTSIPDGLFDNNPAATDFSNCFSSCKNLTSIIPVGLFDNNPLATTFASCFRNCPKLTSIPDGLFANNPAATDFSYCFNSCENLVLNANMFCDEATQKATRFYNKTVSFKQCFYYCNGNGGTAPALWEYNFGTGTPNSTACFGGNTNISNWDVIPTTWGGPAAGN